MKAIFSIICIGLILCGSVLICGCTSDQAPHSESSTGNGDQKNEELLVYCGAGMREPMEEVATAFTRETGVGVNFNFAGSNTLLSQMELTELGDVYMPGATYYFEAADEKGLIDRSHLVAYHVPIIVTPKGNPAHITCLDDLATPGMKVELGDPGACAIGKLCNKLLDNNGIRDDVEANVVARGATVNELVVHTSLGQVDASIIWEDLYNEKKMDRIDIPAEKNIVKVIPIGSLTFSKHPDEADEFIDFVVSDTGAEIFEEFGFSTYPDPSFENA